jgi:hypothetical protein
LVTTSGGRPGGLKTNYVSRWSLSVDFNAISWSQILQ